MTSTSISTQRGRSLLEIFIALAIGAVIIAAVLATIGATGVSGRRTDVQSRMTEDAQIAFSLMGTHLRMGASSLARVVQVTGTGASTSNYSGPPVTGCDAGFTDAAVGITLATCAAGAGNASFATYYEADAFNTVPDAANVPTDCAGRPIVALQPGPTGIGGTFPLAENRFFIAVNPTTGDPELYCVGSGNAPATAPFSNPVPLIGNVEVLRVRYLVQRQAVAPAVTPTYAPDLTAAQVTAANAWPLVTAMEVCLLMRSADNVAAAATPYLDCTGNVVANPPDRRIRRAVITTLQIRNGTTLRTS